MKQFLLNLDRWIDSTDNEIKKGCRIAFLAAAALVLVVGIIIGNIAFIATFPAAGIVGNMLVLIIIMEWLLKD